MWLTGVAISASGIMATQASKAHSIIHTFLTGSFGGPIKPIAITMCEKAANSNHRPAWDI